MYEGYKDVKMEINIHIEYTCTTPKLLGLTLMLLRIFLDRLYGIM
jgi:hypothetical protein